MELMIVIIIIFALSAILMPIISSQWKRWNSSKARLKIISVIMPQLEVYRAENNGYPSMEQGLNALVFIPDNLGIRPMVPQPTGPGPNLTDPNQGLVDPNLGLSLGIGPDVLNQPNQINPLLNDQFNQQIMPTTTPMTDPQTGMPIVDASGITSSLGQMTAAWNDPTQHNPQLYLRQQRRVPPYVSESDLKDPWGTPYRYDNSRAYYGLNMTGSEVPAVWSAGPDKIDNTPDDILGWDPIEAQELINAQQQRLQTQQSGWMMQQPMQQTGIDPNNPNVGFDPNNPNAGFDPNNPNQGFNQTPQFPQPGPPTTFPQSGPPPTTFPPQPGPPTTFPQSGPPPTTFPPQPGPQPPPGF